MAAIPPKKYRGISFLHFDIVDVAHRQKLWFGRVELFFRGTFKSTGGRVFDLDLALLSFLYDFKCLGAVTILQRKGARMFYGPDQPWLIVLPINHIVGRVPLMKAYLEGSDSPTIPSSLARHRQVYFRHGHADRAGSSKGTGSRLCMLNVHIWQYGRPQPRTISVEVRHANLARTRQVSGQKRERRKDLLH